MSEHVSTRTYHECDVCLKEIQNWRPGGMALWDDISDYQYLNVKDGKRVEICSDCCLRLRAFERLGVVSIAWRQLLQSLGLEETEHGWVMKIGKITRWIREPSDG